MSDRLSRSSLFFLLGLAGGFFVGAVVTLNLRPLVAFVSDLDGAGRLALAGLVFAAMLLLVFSLAWLGNYVAAREKRPRPMVRLRSGFFTSRIARHFAQTGEVRRG